MFKHDIKRMLALILALALAALWPLAALGEEAAEPDETAEPTYGENAWDYVDGSMDATQGIPGDAEGVLALIQQRGVLRVATEPYWPPQEFIDPDLDGQASYVGADMEFARLIAERMGVELEILPMDFSVVLDAVAEGEADLAISALAYTPGRAAAVTLSKGYYFSGEDVGNSIVVRAADAEAIQSVKDLEGRDIVAQSGSLQELLMAENVFGYHEFRRLSTIDDVYQAVRQGKADAAAVDVENARSYIEDNPDCGLALVPGIRFEMEEQFKGDRVAAKRGEYQLMYFVNGIIDELLASGQYQAWFDRYGERAAALGM